MNAIRPSPRAILFDLDDTILSAYGRPEPAWLAIAEEFASQLAPLSPAEAVTEIMAQSRIFWADPGDHRYWRMRLFAARRETVARAFKALADAGRPAPSIGVANALADRFSAWREEQISLFPDAHEVIDALKARDLKLALVTNGEAGLQRAKISRFDLARRFDHVQIEGEHGFGKPEERAYQHAMQALGVAPPETWMVGDNLEWEVVAPQRLGIYAVWHDHAGRGLPGDTTVQPDLIIRTLSELIPALDGHQRSFQAPMTVSHDARSRGYTGVAVSWRPLLVAGPRDLAPVHPSIRRSAMQLMACSRAKRLYLSLRFR